MKAGSALFFVLVLSAPVLSAATRFVTTGGTNAGDCTSAPCATISYAVGQATANDVIEVGAGSFDNAGATIVVDKTVVLRGHQFGVDGRGRGGVPETILTMPIALGADGIVFDGFTVTCGPCRACPTCRVDPAIHAASPFAGYQVSNNIIRENWLGFRFNGRAHAPSVIRFNDFIDNDGQEQSIAIFLSPIVQFEANVVIDRNRFRGSVGPQVEAVIWNSPTPGLRIIDNEFNLDTVDDGQAVWLSNTRGVEISGNRVTGGVQPAFVILDASRDVAIVRNVVMNNPKEAVRLGGDVTFPLPPNDAVRIEENTFIGNARGIHVGPQPQGTPEVHFNRFAGNGVDIHTSGANTINAQNNWWGCNDVGSRCGTTSLAAGSTVNLSPWLMMTIAADDRIGVSETSNVTVDFNRNSDGLAVSGFPDTAVSFAALLGSLHPALDETSGGVAATVYTPSATGTGAVTASLDEQDVSVGITIVPSFPRRRSVRR